MKTDDYEYAERVLVYLNSSSYKEDSSTKSRKADIKKKIRELLEENKKLDSFLEKNNAKGRYIKNLSKRILDYEGYGQEEINREINRRMSCCSPIDYSFCWRNTKEGHKYWEKLNREYRDFHV